ncbi:WecB/TagA/CpsF family glycosyltransferase [Evansella sp. AB-rgal1]|uniref:WecB/TagA/CpsF family glycosyltransferase n=1 Tax=Evansella sp. AB-rgal1 TaxID=3242696 RepID=UPI00359EDC58
MKTAENDKKVTILGVSFIHITLDNMVKRLVTHVQEKRKAFVVTANPEIVLYANENKEYKQYIDKADYVTPDGIGIVKGAQLLGQPLPERVTGFDMFMNLLEASNEHRFSIYLLGAKEEVLVKTKDVITKNYPNITIVGSHNGFFDWNDTVIDTEIKEKKPDFVFVALGFPRQEQWIAQRIETFQQGVFIGIGGSFDVLAGEVKRAPEVWQKLNLEWFYRLVKQPSRWRRMLALPRFAVKIFGNKMKRSS